MALFVANTSFNTTAEDLTTAFSTHGSVVSVVLPADRKSKRPLGYAFVEMSTPEEGAAALAAGVRCSALHCESTGMQAHRQTDTQTR